MKIRNGFVSNSSSSSFCIYGNYVESEDSVFEAYERIVGEPYDKTKDNADRYEASEDAAYKIASKLGNNCAVYVDWDNERFYFGLSYEAAPGSQTFDEFRSTCDDITLQIMNQKSHHIEQEIYS